MSDSPLSLPAFKSWLAASPNLVVGQPQLFCDCPLANFLASIGFERPMVIVSEFTYFNGQDREMVGLPPWAMAFMDKIDNLEHSSTECPLTGQFCLSILSNLPEVEALESAQ